MKININFIFTYFILIALLKNADGGLVKGLIERIHDTVHKINEDVHNIFVPQEKKDLTNNNKQGEIKVNPADAVKSNNENSGSNINFPTSATTENVKNYNNSFIASPIKTQDVHPEPVIKVVTTEETFVFATSSSTVAPVSSTTVKEGRENFAAGCSTGYKRTADGRCKPTF